MSNITLLSNDLASSIVEKKVIDSQIQDIQQGLELKSDDIPIVIDDISLLDKGDDYFFENDEFVEEIPSNLFDFLKMKMYKRNGLVDSDNDEKDEIEVDTDFVHEIKTNKKIYKSKGSLNKSFVKNIHEPKRKIIITDDNYESLDESSSASFSTGKESRKIEMIPISKIVNQKKFIIKGLVQSGKTEYMICLMLYMLMCGKSVVVVLRNIDDDRVQFSKRYLEFKKRYIKYFPELNDIVFFDNILKYKVGRSFALETPKIFVLLDNNSNIKKMNEILIENYIRYVTIFDEADYVDSGKGLKSKQYNILKMRSSKIFWVSATIMDMLSKEEGISGENIIFLRPSDSDNYKGIINSRIGMKTIPDSKYVGEIDEDVFELNPYFDTFLGEYKCKEVYSYEYSKNSTSHPNICLVNLSHCIEPLEKAQIRIARTHPELSVIVYNSTGLVFQKGDTKIRGENVMNSYGEKCKNVSRFLQYMKENGGVKEYSHIIIMSGYMAGRGISFVSDDYQWHITDEYLVMSKTADEPELIQKVRLQGIYKDNIPLTLYTTEDVQKDLLKACFRMEELSKACKDGRDSECKKLLAEIPVMKDKFTKRDMTKNISIKMNKVRQNIGWSMQTYQGKDLVPDDIINIYGFDLSLSGEMSREEFRKANGYEEKEDKEENTKTIEDINRILMGKKTCISMFLSQLCPTMEYSKPEVIELLKESGYKQPSSIFSSIINPNTKYAYYILKATDSGKWKIRDGISVCWNS